MNCTVSFIVTALFSLTFLVTGGIAVAALVKQRFMAAILVGVIALIIGYLTILSISSTMFTYCAEVARLF